MICWYNRLKISHKLDQGSELPDGLKRHIDSCEGCRWFYEANERVGGELARHAPGVSPVYGEILRGVVLRGSGRGQRVGSGQFWLGRRSILAMAAVWAIIMTFGFYAVIGLFDDEKGVDPAKFVEVKPTVSSEIMALREFISNEIYPVETVVDDLQKLIQEVVDSPNEEMEQISRDGNLVVDSLLACLPIDAEGLMGTE